MAMADHNYKTTHIGITFVLFYCPLVTSFICMLACVYISHGVFHLSVKVLVWMCFRDLDAQVNKQGARNWILRKLKPGLVFNFELSVNEQREVNRD